MIKHHLGNENMNSFYFLRFIFMGNKKLTESLPSAGSLSSFEARSQKLIEFFQCRVPPSAALPGLSEGTGQTAEQPEQTSTHVGIPARGRGGLNQ